MVAITVILAAVIGAFVFSLGGQQEQPPQARLDIDIDGEQVTVRHDSGDALSADATDIVVDGSAVGSGALESGGPDETYTAGETIYTGTVDSGTEILIVWRSPTSDRTTTLGHATLPWLLRTTDHDPASRTARALEKVLWELPDEVAKRIERDRPKKS